ncbi:RNA-binding protein CP31B, chloroplastic-like [Cyclospora cayetanensis]|uniref:RNA-binding protein CP31B, chloroplastic-like n=1 Tax=Cyclospora cayetanensis TaxID=88456 RepID=A0A6P6RQS9_9EIME|nr:RNA-binding protein CP31B, chloroplastic-like [Cyclospora cayetanensis]
MDSHKTTHDNTEGRSLSAASIEEVTAAPQGASFPGTEGPRPFRFFIGGLPQEVDEDAVNELFSRYGTVRSVRLAKDYATGRKKGFGFVTMDSGASESAIFNTIQYLRGKRIDIRRENDSTPTDFPRKVFVGGLPPSLGIEGLATELGRFGEVEAVQIVTDCGGQSRCFGFVTFKQKRVAESLIGQGACRIGVSVAFHKRAATT